ncbi:MAG: GerAB/ArcD/ProY family transporter [Clostridia bacterium]|nr:GerAB/ArcD/ProY family transporter [Clostridia bacterium]
MLRTQTLYDRQIALFFLSVVPFTKFFTLPSLTAGISGNDMWISAILNLVLDIVTVLIVLSACKKSNVDFFGLIENIFGKVGGKIVLILYAIFFLLKGFIPICEQKDYVVLTMYLALPKIAMFLPFFVLAVYLCCKRLRVIGRLSDVLFIPTVIGFVLLMALTIPNLEMGALLPIGLSGAKNIFKASYSSLNWYGDCVYLLFFIGRFKREKRSNLKIIIAYIVAGLMVVVFSLFFYATFSSLAFRKKFALTEISKYTTVINNIGRFDFIAIFLILFSSAFATIMPIYFACMLLQRALPLKKHYIYPLILSLLIMILMFGLNEYFASLESFFTGIAGIIFLIFSNLLPIVLALSTGFRVPNNKRYRGDKDNSIRKRDGEINDNVGVDNGENFSIVKGGKQNEIQKD